MAGLCLEKFRGLPGKGKPVAGKEWTLLAGVVQRQLRGADGGRLKVVSLATGTRCVGASKLCGKGTLVNDSHAEVKRKIHHRNKRERVGGFVKLIPSHSVRRIVKLINFTRLYGRNWRAVRISVDGRNVVDTITDVCCRVANCSWLEQRESRPEILYTRQYGRRKNVGFFPVLYEP